MRSFVSVFTHHLTVGLQRRGTGQCSHSVQAVPVWSDWFHANDLIAEGKDEGMPK
ncbi:hypothetical protein CRB79_004727 [Salmonella enterica subsp. enterica serovar Enteritidis]|nr:hypothetical protein [Salmonella enterica subsp. enterica serovar Enteritidis]EGT9239895.1 hypothetical protein [Salmonella enterica]